MSDLHEWYTLAKGETKQWRRGPFVETRYKFFLTREFPDSYSSMERLLLFERIVEEAVANMLEESAPAGRGLLHVCFSDSPISGSTVQLFAEEPEVGKVIFSSKRMPIGQFDASDFLQRLAAMVQSDNGPSFDDMDFLINVYQLRDTL